MIDDNDWLSDEKGKDSRMQTDNPNAPDYDWQADREWFNQRLANARIHNSDLERKIASQNEVIRQKSAQISRLQSTIEKLRDGSPEITKGNEL